MTLSLRAASLLLLSAVPAFAANTIPSATGTALDGHAISLPRDLHGRATVLILGFSQHSADATTAWEKTVRNSFASTPAISYYDMPFLEDAPSLLRPMILRSIRKQVPDFLKPNFVPLTSGEAAWKQTSGFTSAAPDAAYVLLVDKSGHVRWQTHEACSPTLFDQLTQAAQKLSTEAQ